MYPSVSIGRNIAYILFFVFFFTETYGHSSSVDSVKRVQSIGVAIHGGLFVPHHKEMGLFRERGVKGFELSYRVFDLGSSLWHSQFKGPEFGVMYLMLDMGSPTYLGYSHSFIPFVAFPFTPPSSNFRLYSRWGYGVGYLTKPFHRTNNFKNSAYSMYINPVVNLALGASFRVSESITTSIDFSISHISNGTFQKPNSGLNFLSLSAGAALVIVSEDVPKLMHHSFTDSPGRLLIVGAGAIKEEMGAGGPKFRVGTGSLEYSRRLTALTRYGISFDAMHDQSVKYVMEARSIDFPDDFLNLALGGTLNYEVILDRISAVFYFGYYFHNDKYWSGDLYQRLGLRYRFHERLWAHCMLKTHWGKADYLEWGLVFKIF